MDAYSATEEIKKNKDIFVRARMLQYLRRDKEMRLAEISRLTGLKSSYISHYLRLLRLPEIVVDGYYSQTISSSHLFILSRLKNPNDMRLLYERILKDNYSVIQTEYAVREMNYGIKSKGSYIESGEVALYKDAVSRSFPGMSLKLIQSRTASKVVLEMKGELRDTSAVVKSVLGKISQ